MNEINLKQMTRFRDRNLVSPFHDFLVIRSLLWQVITHHFFYFSLLVSHLMLEEFNRNLIIFCLLNSITGYNIL